MSRVHIDIYDAPSDLYHALPGDEQIAKSEPTIRWKTIETESASVTYFAPRSPQVGVEDHRER